MKSSSDVVGAVIKELRLQSGQPESDFRMAVAVDGVNALWGRSTIKKEDKSTVRKTHSQSCQASCSSSALSTDGKSHVSLSLSLSIRFMKSLPLSHSVPG